MITVRHSFHYAYPYLNLVLAGIALLVGPIAGAIYLKAFGGFEEIEPGVFHASNISEGHGIIMLWCDLLDWFGKA